MAHLHGSARTRALTALGSRQPAATNADSQLVPICLQDAKAQCGQWKPVHILTDHIALEAGFSKNAYQAQCVVYGDEEWKFVHVKKQHPWFAAAVGGPMLKKGDMPTVHVIDELNAKVFGKQSKESLHEDRSRGEDGENECEAQIDPMAGLAACEPDLETPKKLKKARKREVQRSLVREIEMLQRPLFVGGEAALSKTVHVYIKPNSKALYIRVDCIDWLVSYAADEHHYQGVSRVGSAAPQPATDYAVEWDYNNKSFECTINVGKHAGLTWRSTTTDTLTQDVFAKLAERDFVDGFWSQANQSVKRKACRELLNLWCAATIDGGQHKFEEDWGCTIPSKKLKISVDNEQQSTAVAASLPATAGEVASGEHEQQATAVAAASDDSQ